MIRTKCFHCRGHKFHPLVWELTSCKLCSVGKNNNKKDSERIQNPWTILMYDYASTQTTPDFVLWFYALDGFSSLFLKVSVLCTKSLQSFPTLCNPIDHCPRCSSHPQDSPGKKTGSFSRGSSKPRDPNALAGRFSTTSTTWEGFLKVILVNRMITRNIKEYKRKWYTKQTKFIWATLVEELEQECYQAGLW